MTKKFENPLVLAILAIAFFVPFLGSTHLFDWDEINFAESAREMIVSGNYLRVQIDFHPFWEKPPLFFWMQALSMHIFGINEFAARFPNAVMGVVTLLTFFYIGRSLIDARFGFLWALAYLGSFTPHLYFKSGIIDPTFNYFMFLSVYFLYKTQSSKSLKMSLLAGLFSGLAVWTKGPVGVAIPTIVLGVVWAFNRFKPIISWRQLLVYALVSGGLSVGWVLLLIYESSWQTFVDFVSYLYRLMATSEADHGQPFYYHFVVVLLGCFPISVIGLLAFGSRQSAIGSRLTTYDLRLFMTVLFLVVMVVFSLVKTKIVHYSSLAYFPLSFLAALYLYKWLKGEVTWPRWATVLLLFIGFLMSTILTALPLVGKYAPLASAYIQDDFVVANLQAPVQWAGFEWIFGTIYFMVLIGVIFVWNKHKILSIRILFFATAILMFVYSAVVVPKLEGYTQRTAIDFYESKRGQDVYVWPIGFHSYAQLFYFNKPPNTRPEASNENWLLNGPVDKPTFFVSRIDRQEPYRHNPNLELIKEENGFVFFKRKVKLVP